MCVCGKPIRYQNKSFRWWRHFHSAHSLVHAINHGSTSFCLESAVRIYIIHPDVQDYPFAFTALIFRSHFFVFSYSFLLTPSSSCCTNMPRYAAQHHTTPHHQAKSKQSWSLGRSVTQDIWLDSRDLRSLIPLQRVKYLLCKLCLTRICISSVKIGPLEQQRKNQKELKKVISIIKHMFHRWRSIPWHSYAMKSWRRKARNPKSEKEMWYTAKHWWAIFAMTIIMCGKHCCYCALCMIVYAVRLSSWVFLPWNVHYCCCCYCLLVLSHLCVCM